MQGGLLEVMSARPNLKTLVEDYERQLIEAALKACSGNQRRAAAQLGLLPTTLHEKMKRLGLLPRRAAELPSPFDPPLR